MYTTCLILQIGVNDKIKAKCDKVMKIIIACYYFAVFYMIVYNLL